MSELREKLRAVVESAPDDRLVSMVFAVLNAAAQDIPWAALPDVPLEGVVPEEDPSAVRVELDARRAVPTLDAKIVVDDRACRVVALQPDLPNQRVIVWAVAVSEPEPELHS